MRYPSTNQTADAGSDWNSVITQANSMINSEGASGYVFAMGGSDIELEYATGTSSSNWTVGYTDNENNSFAFLGDASNCPQSSGSGTSCACPQPPGGCMVQAGWTQFNLSAIANGDNAAGSYQAGFPLPQIYGQGSANEWGQLLSYNVYPVGELNSYNRGVGQPPSQTFTEMQEQYATYAKNEENIFQYLIDLNAVGNDLSQ